ncbi:hypothetical protein HPB49_012518 [Dermacentor silvarum]|uniref:Uncharacterized protein n=1 Tax=Dermacentor silvarum TaxID=543639 RepID=A0ACB8C983_DERSI|nr:hypothetical protein HPB49_012518 [Dermacentor silvarum]
MPIARVRRRLNRVPRFGPDSRESWLMVVVCGLLLFLCFSTIGVSGVFFYGIVETFGVSREEASWPVTLSCALLLLAGPIMGFLSKRYSCRKVLLGCSLISGFAVSMCFFARSITCITILFGIVHGNSAVVVRGTGGGTRSGASDGTVGGAEGVRAALLCHREQASVGSEETIRRASQSTGSECVRRVAEAVVNAGVRNKCDYFPKTSEEKAAICDADMRILTVYPMRPGSDHDSFAWRTQPTPTQTYH